MRVAPENFRQRVSDIDNLELRHKFILDALKWAQGEPASMRRSKITPNPCACAGCCARSKSLALPFDPNTLDAFVHLTAPPPPPASES